MKKSIITYFGKIIKAKNKHNEIRYYRVLGVNEAGEIILRAIGETLQELERELQQFKDKNALIKNIQEMSLTEFATMSVETAWFANREISVVC